MKCLELSRSALSSFAIAVLLAGCGNNALYSVHATPQIVEPGGSGVGIISPAAKPCNWLSQRARTRQRLMYVANDDEILVFPEQPHNPAAVGCVATGAGSSHGLYVDRHDNIYIANGNGTVAVYPQGSLTPSATYSTGTAGPMFPIADDKGNVFVSTNNGRVLEFLRGRTTPYRTLYTPGYEADGIAFDRSGNLYVTYRTAYLAGSIEKFPPKSTHGQILGMQIIQPQGIVIADDGTIVVVETGRADGVYVFAPGSQTPQLEVDVPETPVELALTEPEHKIFVSAFGWLGSGCIYVAPYPLTSTSRFHVKRVFSLKYRGHRRHDRFQIQGVALGNGAPF